MRFDIDSGRIGRGVVVELAHGDSREFNWDGNNPRKARIQPASSQNASYAFRHIDWAILLDF
jgi:hypothetical protein